MITFVATQPLCNFPLCSVWYLCDGISLVGLTGPSTTAQCHEIKSRSCQESWQFIPRDVSSVGFLSTRLLVLETIMLKEFHELTERLQLRRFGCSAWKMLLDWSSSTDEQTNRQTRKTGLGARVTSTRKRCSFEPVQAGCVMHFWFIQQCHC